MANNIDSYLKELQQALAGSDRALVQDAVFDAEEYLQAELAAGADFTQVVERYGTPEEVAAAYVDVPRPAPSAEAAVMGPTTGSLPPSGQLRAEKPSHTVGPPQATAPVPSPASAQTAPPPVQTPTPGQAPPAGQSPPPYFGPAPGMPAQPGAADAAVGAPATVGPGPAGAPWEATAAKPGPWRQVFGVFIDPRVYKSLLYMILSLITGVAYFTIVVTGLSVAGSLLVLIIGIPLLLLVLGIVRGMALFEGRLVEVLLGTRMPRRPRAEPPNAGFLQRMLFWIKDGRTWASMAYMILMLPLGVIYFTIAVTGLAVGLSLITTPFWAWILQWADFTYTYQGVTHTWQLQIWAIPIAVIVGALVLTGWLHLVRWIGRGHAAFAKAFLVRLSR